MARSTAEELEATLRAMPESELLAYLSANSGLPGPRANLSLADAFAAAAGRARILRVALADDEYLRFCGTEAIGRLLVETPNDQSLHALLRERAMDAAWRVREGAARALQLVGDRDPVLLREIVTDWCAADNPWVRRAALAGVCEPRLLKQPETAELALWACQRATEFITHVPVPERRDPGVRNLRQALGYCWSVAVAVDPERGLPLFDELRTSPDSDVQWIVESNLKKARLKRLTE